MKSEIFIDNFELAYELTMHPNLYETRDHFILWHINIAIFPMQLFHAGTT